MMFRGAVEFCARLGGSIPVRLPCSLLRDINSKQLCVSQLQRLHEELSLF